jgi:aromatic-L-amino-acid decarboxylase
VIRHYGIEGLQFHIRKHVELARKFSTWVKQSEDFEIFVEPPFNLVCFRHKAGDDFNMKLMNAVNATGKAYFTHTKLNGQVVLRMSIGQTHTEENHVKATWDLIREMAASKQ